MEELINNSIEVIKKGEKLALNMNANGYHIAFSGGKDSIVLYDLFKKSGCKGQAYFYNTQLEIPEIPIFIRKNYPDVKFLYPEKTFFELISKKQILPTRRVRFCCYYLKEMFGTGSVVLTGIRKAESARRKKQNQTNLKHICVKGSNEKILLSPILDFSENDIYKYIEDNNLVLPNFYKTKKRSGCIGCPMNANRVNELIEHPKILAAMKKAIAKTFDVSKSKFDNVDDMFEWWFSNKSIKNYIESKKQLELWKNS